MPSFWCGGLYLRYPPNHRERSGPASDMAFLQATWRTPVSTNFSDPFRKCVTNCILYRDLRQHGKFR